MPPCCRLPQFGPRGCEIMECMHVQDATPLKGDRMVVQWMRDVTDIAELRRLSDGSLLATLSEGMPGTMSGVYTEPLRASTEFWYLKETFLEPPAIFRCDAGTAPTDVTTPGTFDPHCNLQNPMYTVSLLTFVAVWHYFEVLEVHLLGIIVPLQLLQCCNDERFYGVPLPESSRLGATYAVFCGPVHRSALWLFSRFVNNRCAFML